MCDLNYLFLLMVPFADVLDGGDEGVCEVEGRADIIGH
jgi:hypothetical protein